MRVRTKQFLAVAIMAAAPLMAYAHHSFAAIWDIDKSFEISGTLEGVDWINPHSQVHVKTLDASGGVTEYAFEGFPPLMLRHFGITRDDFTNRVGQKVTVLAYGAKDGSKTIGFGRSYKFEDGTTFVALKDPKDIPAN